MCPPYLRQANTRGQVPATSRSCHLDPDTSSVVVIRVRDSFASLPCCPFSLHIFVCGHLLKFFRAPLVELADIRISFRNLVVILPILLLENRYVFVLDRIMELIELDGTAWALGRSQPEDRLPNQRPRGCDFTPRRVSSASSRRPHRARGVTTRPS